ncbi:fatty acid desaturase [Tabrizicola sp. J26]|uniref:fatty acid desaturase n=1 Tax=Alitabrizicola rongguiensis TaxID=2909234 RepID=UPI001F232145|nr:fatty acid desaturase [Tabrizicola rongguiensis]MCF1708841.1 fatty acid desaturase [Tabrizicola rongguiensis]
MRSNTTAVEWPTVLLMAATYALWVIGTTWAASLWLPLGIGLTAVAIAQFSSLQHEVIHGHPFPSQALNDALVFPALMPYVPYERFRTTHLQHHYDPALTDPYDDPESNYQDPAVWARMPSWAQTLLRLNNTLLGRMLLGPAIGTVLFVQSDLRLLRGGQTEIRRAWALHGIGLLLVLGWLLAVGSMPVLAYLLSAYLAYSVLKIRTYLEHRAHEAARARTVLIEDRGPLSLLFLNNNLHVVHHMHPAVPWYRLPAMYAANRDHYLRRNEGYRYVGYGEVFRRYFLKAKDPVPHPIWPVQRNAMPPQDERIRAAE